MNTDLPSGAGEVAAKYPSVWKALEALGEACAAAGPLDARTRRLVKLALAIGVGSEGATHSHTRRALEEGIEAAALQQVALLAIATTGFPSAVRGLTWVDDVVGAAEPSLKDRGG
jgi:alkylhydroperoxidase/carboxymuconolactone decarboxylase family protein YurZ